MIMLHPKLINPESIVVIGGSDNTESIGGSVLKNLIEQKFLGELYVVNPNKDKVQKVTSFRDASLLPKTDLAIIAIPAPDIEAVVTLLLQEKGTKAFIIYAAGFAELNDSGRLLQENLTK